MYSIDYRKRAVEYKREGHSFKELSETFKIVPQTYYNWAKEYDDNGFTKPREPQQRSRKIDKDQLIRALEEQPDAYLHELAALFNCTPQAVFYALEKLDVTLKKKTFTYSEKSEEQRQAYIAALSQVPEESRVYVDESGVNCFLQRERGRALRGKKVWDVKRGRKFKRTNVIGGMLGGKYMAVRCYDHTTTSAFWGEWFRDDLLPQVPKGCTIIMDNASFHRKNILCLLAAEAGVRLLFLPPYSPVFNPIEHAWANLKRWLRDNIMRFCFLDTAICEYLRWNMVYNN